jgi:sterol desaturase/sphingolipid hydroxylase (fatty acid hydroxylase superfamily)
MQFLSLLQSQVPAWALHAVQLAIWLFLLSVVFLPLERVFALRPAKLPRAQLGVDVAYYFLNSLLPAALLSVPVAALVAGGQALMPPTWRASLTSLPWWVAVPFALVLADLGAYWGHRLSHEIPLLWRFHEVHHSAEHMDFLVHTRAHPIDMVVVRLFALAPVSLLGINGPALQGGAPPLLAAVVTIVGGLVGFFVHANVRYRLGPLEWMVATPAFHHWHHSRVEHINRNYAATFPWIDRLFGTLHLPVDRWPTAYGLEQPLSPSIARQLLGPLAKSVGFDVPATAQRS